MAILFNFNNKTFHVGDQILVYYKIIEHELISGKTKREKKEEVKERIQPFEGIIIAIRGNAENRNFIVRKIASRGIGVERIFPLNSPWIKKITLKKRGRTKRAKLYFLRHKTIQESQKQLKSNGSDLESSTTDQPPTLPTQASSVETDKSNQHLASVITKT